MDNNIYIAVTKQLAVFHDMEVTGNNLANANTVGFTAERMLFSSYLDKDINEGNRNQMAFANAATTMRDLSEGSIQVTGNDLDVAISGPGYFALQTPLGQRYTRAGNFQLDGTGTLVSSDGYPVLDNGGQPITLPENTSSVQIGQAGNIKVNGEDFTNIGVYNFANPQLLERLNGRLFRSNVTPQAADNVTVLQGSLESSNVQPVVEMTHMIEVARSVEGIAKYIEVVYDLERKASQAWAQQS